VQLTSCCGPLPVLHRRQHTELAPSMLSRCFLKLLPTSSRSCRGATFCCTRRSPDRLSSRRRWTRARRSGCSATSHVLCKASDAQGAGLCRRVVTALGSTVAVASTNRGVCQEVIGTSIAFAGDAGLGDPPHHARHYFARKVGKGRSLDPVRLTRSGAPESVDAGLSSIRREEINAQNLDFCLVWTVARSNSCSLPQVCGAILHPMFLCDATSLPP